MNGFDGGRLKTWNVYSSINPSPSQADTNKDGGGPWKDFGSSVNAISFGFVATAVLISMFLIMAIFEHLFRPTTPHHGIESRQMRKLGAANTVHTSSYPSAFSVVMPGQQQPTFIAQPAPLPCPREAVLWPPHGHHTITFT